METVPRRRKLLGVAQMAFVLIVKDMIIKEEFQLCHWQN
ncbi:hypothetical protein COMA2_140063 [Candidatus Nitrospira nitrificans]|uniref:Uncharacterized protein n=1 Tax=Candidatus Nitrospira nitrificans TaxID=1742973 RepID=A0A0S4LAB1_9BACT|nr:hypothetical protein COMA2_140063 [Candidatus Nitrospira nitrificans]